VVPKPSSHAEHRFAKGSSLLADHSVSCLIHPFGLAAVVIAPEFRACAARRRRFICNGPRIPAIVGGRVSTSTVTGMGRPRTKPEKSEKKTVGLLQIVLKVLLGPPAPASRPPPPPPPHTAWSLARDDFRCGLGRGIARCRSRSTTSYQWYVSTGGTLGAWNGALLSAAMNLHAFRTRPARGRRDGSSIGTRAGRQPKIGR